MATKVSFSIVNLHGKYLKYKERKSQTASQTERKLHGQQCGCLLVFFRDRNLHKFKKAVL